MEMFGLISKLFLVLFLSNTLYCTNIDFQRMAGQSTILIFIKSAQNRTHDLGFMLEASESVAVYKLRDADYSIKVLYPITFDKNALFKNEMFVLKRITKKFDGNPGEKGIVRFIDGGEGSWKHYKDETILPGNCSVVVYTYGKPLFPILRQYVQKKDRKMLFWSFSQMAKSMHFVETIGRTFHNNIGPDVFRLNANGTVFLDNFEIARSLVISNPSVIYVTQNDFPIGFKPTMSRSGMNAKTRNKVCQLHSFELTSYYILDKRLPWQMDAIDYLWNVNMIEARELTFKLKGIDLQEYYRFKDPCNRIHSDVLNIIKKCGRIGNYWEMSEEFLRLSAECPSPHNY